MEHKRLDAMVAPIGQRGKRRGINFFIGLITLLITLGGLAKLVLDVSSLYEYDATCHYAIDVGSIRELPGRLEAELYLAGEGCQSHSAAVPRLRFLVDHETATRLHVVIQDVEGKRYQVPEDILPRPVADMGQDATRFSSELAFDFVSDDRPFGFRVLRRLTGEVLFDTSDTDLVFDRQFLRLKTWLPKDPNIYGLGEHTDSFRLPTRDYKRTFWARDAGGVPHRSNLYGSHPLYVDHRLSGTHGVFLVNSNGMDIVLNQDSQRDQNYLEYRAIGGIFDFYFLAGPTPTDVSTQYAEVVGKPAMVPYWSLGFHQCKYGYQDWFEVAEVVHNYSAAGIPLETIWTDIDYMDHRRIFTLDGDRFPVEKMQDLTAWLRRRNQHYILMIDPAVAHYDYHAFNRGMEMGVFMSHKDGSPFRGVVWPGVTVFPDWWHPNASGYWAEMFDKTFNPDTGVDIDGVWIDMNEPASFCRFPCNDPEKAARDQHMPPAPPPVRTPPRKIPGFPNGNDKATRDRFAAPHPDRNHQKPLTGPNQPHGEGTIRVEIDHEGDDLLRPPYRIDNHVPTHELSDKTVYTDLQHANGQWTYDTHNLYGMLMGMATQTAMLSRRPNMRPFIITRSTFAGSGRYTGKWLGDNVSKWDHYRVQIAGMLNFASLFQIPMVGSDVCGFLGTSNEKLCARWATLGAFNPFYRNHADDRSPHQEFYLWPTVTRAAKYAIDIRYRLLDYLYTALSRQSIYGTPALSPLWFMYPQDQNTFPIDLQFFYGDCILVAPVTDDSTRVRVYLPDDQFYEFDTGKPVRGRGEWIDLPNVPYDRIPLYVRGGCTLPLRAEGAMTTAELREKGFEIMVAPGLDGEARGSLYMDDGETLDGGESRVHVDFEFSADEGLTTRVMSPLSAKVMSLEAAGIRIEKITVLGRGSQVGQADEQMGSQDEL